jgi:pimeloyl-ACP methyl ester carboxylesterase
MMELRSEEKKMKQLRPFLIKRTAVTLLPTLLLAVLFVTSCTGHVQQSRTEEIVFQSGSFRLVGDLRFPEGEAPHPVVVFVHGDGPNDRTSGVTYPPIMSRMERAGYATFAWDKPGTGESTGRIDDSRLGEQRAQIVLDAIEVLKARSDIDSERIGLWGISQAGYVMPRVLSKSEDVAFMIAVSCAAMPGVDQGAYMVSAQAVCAGIPEATAERIKHLLSAIERVRTYDEYVEYKKLLDALPGIEAAAMFGYKKGARPEAEWHPGNPEGEYFWNPMEVIERTTIPVLAVFGEMDTQVDPFQGTQAYRDALARAGHPHSRVELIPGTDHNIILSKTGCLDEREQRSRRQWTDYAPEYLDVLEDWLRDLRSQSG